MPNYIFVNCFTFLDVGLQKNANKYNSSTDNWNLVEIISVQRK